MDGIVLLEREDLSPILPHGQCKLLLKALQALRPQTTEEVSDRENTVDWAATPIEACISADNIAGDTSRNVTAAPVQIGETHQHSAR